MNEKETMMTQQPSFSTTTDVTVSSGSDREKFAELQKLSNQVRKLIKYWYKHKLAMEKYEQLIKSIVCDQIKYSVHSEEASVIYCQGRDKIDYERVVEEIKPSKKIINKYTTVHIDYKGICEEMHVPDEILEKYISDKSAPYAYLKVNKKEQK
jgi:hypothetical protein